MLVVLVVVVALWAPAAVDAANFEFKNVVYPGTQRIVNRQFCDNSAAFALTGALEIANQRLTGEKTKLAEQEIVDCYYNGCSQVLVGDLAEWLQIQDRLAPADQYNYDFQSKQDDDGTSCRAGQAPDALDKIEIVGIESIEVSEIEASVEEHGSVLVCMDNRDTSCPGYYRKKSEIVAGQDKLDIYQDNDGDGVIDGHQQWFAEPGKHVVTGNPSKQCYHNVLIVGTHSEGGVDYWVVRDSRGDSWARRGYFLIEQGGNECGIESYPKVLKTQLRAVPKDLDPDTRCPSATPQYCAISRSCTEADSPCITPDPPVVYDPIRDAPRNTDVVYDFTGRPECQDSSGYEEICKSLAATWGDCMVADIQGFCAGSCLMCARSNCVDVERSAGECAKYSSYCHLPAVRAMCAYTCQMHPSDCGGLQENVDLLVGSLTTPHGDCTAPVIANGRVTNEGTINAGDKLEIECDAGYVLSGTDNYCVLQSIYGPDSRLIQTCVAATSGMEYTGVGADLSSTVSTTLAGTTCANWLEVTLTGKYEKATVSEGLAYKTAGNNNFCRNPTGLHEDEEAIDYAPYCLTYDVNLAEFGDADISFGEDVDKDATSLTSIYAKKTYCADAPKCGGGLCDNPLIFDEYPYCALFNTKDCYYSVGEKQAEFMWGFCQFSCCVEIGCLAAPTGGTEATSSATETPPVTTTASWW